MKVWVWLCQEILTKNLR